MSVLRRQSPRAEQRTCPGPSRIRRWYRPPAKRYRIRDRGVRPRSHRRRTHPTRAGSTGRLAPAVPKQTPHPERCAGGRKAPALRHPDAPLGFEVRTTRTNCRDSSPNREPDRWTSGWRSRPPPSLREEHRARTRLRSFREPSRDGYGRTADWGGGGREGVAPGREV